MSQHLFRALVLSFFLVGCVGNSLTLPETNVRQLTTLLQTLDEKIPQAEARQLSEDIFSTTERLRESFEMTSPPLWHNFLVNVGIRDKGLCYHWSDALYLYLSQKTYPSFDFHLLVSDRGKYFLEHNVLVVVAKGGVVEEGVIIDPWRASGKLYFSKVKEDSAYRWKHREERGCKR